MTRRSFFAVAGSAALLRAETPQERGRKVIADTIQALGGDGFRQMRTRIESGRAYSFYREQISGLSIAKIYTKYTAEGEVQRQVFGKKQDSSVLLTNKAAFDITYRGAKPLGDDRVKQFHESTLHDVLYILRARASEPGISFDAKGRDVVENQPVETIDIVDSENRTVTVWIHADTMLPVKQRYLQWDPIVNDRRELITRYSKYRQSGNGVMWPYDTERERDGEKLFELYADKVTVGEDVSDSMFELPAGITILKK